MKNKILGRLQKFLAVTGIFLACYVGADGRDTADSQKEAMKGSENTRKIVDVLGREVLLPQRVSGVILGESRFIPAVSIVNGDNPARNIKAMVDDLKRYDPGTWNAYITRYPALGNIPTIGASSAETFSTEKAISLGANVAIFGIRGHGPGAKDREIIALLEAAGVSIVFIDFRHAPLKNTLLSVDLLGKIFGREKDAESFVSFYQKEMAKVKTGLEQTEKAVPPKVFIHSRVGLREECCESMADTMIGQLVAAAGGINVATSILPGVTGVISPELLLMQPPDIYLATAIGSAHSAEESTMISLGVEVTPSLTETTFTSALQQYRLTSLKAVKDGRAYALWHHFYNSPANVIAIQRLAKWFYPGVFKDLNPDHTLQQFYQQFQRVPLEGVYWYQLGSVASENRT